MALTQVKTLGIAADAVTGAKVADDQIDSEHYVAASIDHEHLADDAVDGDNIFGEGMTIYGRWTAVSLAADYANGGVICYFGE